MKKLVLLSFAIVASLQSYAQYEQNFAIGVKFGEPVGLNVRKYFQYGDKAFDVNFGTYGFLYGTEKRYNKGEYNGAGFMFQGIYSWHKSLTKRENVHFYYGFGGQINSRNHYPDDRIGERNNSEKRLSLGPAGNAGIEIDLPNNNLGAFLEAGAYLEALPRPFFVHPTVSIGARVNLIK